MVLLRGDGIRLTFDGGRRAVLDAVGDVVEFDGALATGCELLGGPCTDLNLMVSRSVRAVAGVQRLHQPHFVHSSSHGTTLVFGISGTLAIECGKGGLTTLAAGEAAVMAPQDHGTISPAVDQCAAPLVFFAALDDT